MVAKGVMRLSAEDPFSHTSEWDDIPKLLFGRVIPPYHSAILEVTQEVFRDVVANGTEISDLVDEAVHLTSGVQGVCQSLRAFILFMGQPSQAVLVKCGIIGYEDFKTMQESFFFDMRLLWAPFSCCMVHDEAREKPGSIPVIV